jgi:hypothetical protein
MTHFPTHLSRRIAHLVLGLLAISFSDGAGAVEYPDQAPSKPQKPNILVLLADDLGNNDIRAFNSAEDIDTPDMDAIARDGTRFHTESTCMPSRATLLTVRGIPPHFTTLPEALRNEGYANRKRPRHAQR